MYSYLISVKNCYLLLTKGQGSIVSRVSENLESQIQLLSAQQAKKKRLWRLYGYGLAGIIAGTWLNLLQVVSMLSQVWGLNSLDRILNFLWSRICQSLRYSFRVPNFNASLAIEHFIVDNRMKVPPLCSSTTSIVADKFRVAIYYANLQLTLFSPADNLPCPVCIFFESDDSLVQWRLLVEFR